MHVEYSDGAGPKATEDAHRCPVYGKAVDGAPCGEGHQALQALQIPQPRGAVDRAAHGPHRRPVRLEAANLLLVPFKHSQATTFVVGDVKEPDAAAAAAKKREAPLPVHSQGVDDVVRGWRGRGAGLGQCDLLQELPVGEVPQPQATVAGTRQGPTKLRIGGGADKAHCHVVVGQDAVILDRGVVHHDLAPQKKLLATHWHA
mmetsp:Transcript_115939/g.328097  ORF Transcript_115939/g.328097 Transcript_115939/m.328097 type:complete len:202 (+) Transcript_115939:555-1160(+)